MADQPDPPANQRPERDATGYWWANLRLIGILLTIWATVSFGSLLAAEWLNQFHIGHLPLGFWMVQQGAIYVFVLLIFVYAWRMDRIDRDHGVDE